MEQKRAKRFYKTVSYAASQGGFEVSLDERALKTPAKAPLILPTEILALAITAEWDAQKEEIAPETMPIFSLAATAIDRVMTQRKTLDDELIGFGENDLISYRCSKEEDPLLAAREAEKWGAIQSWMQERYNVPFSIFEGIMPQAQPASVAQNLAIAVKDIDDWGFVSLYRATTLTGSVSLGLAFVANHLDVAGLMAHAFLDDLYQEEKWGADEWAIERRTNIEAELKDAAHFMALL